MLSLQDIFDGDQVRSDYVSKVKLFGERYCDRFEWISVNVGNQPREGIRYYFGDRFFDWYIPSDNKGIEAFVGDSKLKQSILSFLVKHKP